MELGLSNVRPYLFLPGHIVFFVFNSKEGLVALPIRIVDYEEQKYIFTLDISANSSVSDYKPIPENPTHKNSIFYIPDKYQEYFVQFFLGTDPTVRIFIRYEGKGIKGGSLEYYPKETSLYGFIESNIRDIKPETEVFGFHRALEPVFTFYNPKPLNVNATLVFWGRRYRYLFLTESEVEEILTDKKKFSIRIVGSQLEPCEIDLSWIPIAIPYKEIMKRLSGGE